MKIYLCHKCKNYNKCYPTTNTPKHKYTEAQIHELIVATEIGECPFYELSVEAMFGLSVGILKEKAK